MKKTLTVNLNNTVYHIDSDAYELLQQYLNDVENRLSPAEKKEVMADIEARVSELFSEKLQKGKEVINIQDVEEVIAVLGKPNQFTEEEAEAGADNPGASAKRRYRRKFYRDQDNAIFGGVAAGLAALLGWDVVLIRILLVIILFLGYGTIIPIYILIWAIAPPAKTIAQKLEMQGEDVTAERIKSEINNLKNYVESDKFKESASSIGARLGEIIRAVIKVVFGFVGVIMGIVGVVMLGVLLLVLSLLIFEPTVFAGFTPELSIMSPAKIVLMTVILLFVVGIPIFMLVYSAIRMASGKKRKSATFGVVMGVLWLLSIFSFAGLGAKAFLTFARGDFDHYEFYWDDDNEPDTSEMRHVDPFHGIEVSGNIDVELVQDSAMFVQVQCSPLVMSELKTEVDNGILKIYTNKFHLNRGAKVNIAVKDIDVIKANGACKVKSSGKFYTDNLDIDMSGASKVDMDLNVSRLLRLEMGGACRADLEGVAYRLEHKTSGASKTDASDMLIKVANVSGSGASHIDLNVTDSLDVDVSGATHFSNKRRPVYFRQESSGASKIQFF